MPYTREQLKETVLASYEEKGYSGEVAELAANVLSSYLFLHQMEDISILMEDSFLRSKLLNSRIQHAADNFYSIFRGRNQKIQIDGLNRIVPGTVERFDVIATYGDYKLVYADKYTFTQTEINNGQSFKIDAYLTSENPVTRTFRGTGKLYLDVFDETGNLSTNISEDVFVQSIDDRGTDDPTDDEVYDFTSTNELTDLYSAKSSDGATDTSNVKDICIMTMPNYGVRIWKVDPFLQSYSYVVKYLVCPDESLKVWTEADLEKNIKSIPGFTKTPETTMKIVSTTQYKLSDPDKIYTYASSNIRFSGMMKSVASIDNYIEEYFGDAIQGFNVVVGPDDFLRIPSGTVEIYYCTDYNGDKALDDDLIDGFKKKLQSYYIEDNIEFKNATPVLVPGDIDGGTKYYQYTIHYKNSIDFDLVTKLIKDQQAIVGEDYNPYKVISEIMVHDDLLGKVAWVDVGIVNADGEPMTLPITVKKLEKNQRADLNNDKLRIVFEAVR